MTAKEIYKKYHSINLENLFEEYNMNSFWIQYLPKEIINNDISDIEQKEQINFFEFEKKYCGNNILNGPFFNSIKFLFFLYNKEINLTGIYIDKKNWYIFFMLNNKNKYFKIKYDTSNFEKVKDENIKQLIQKNKIKTNEIHDFMTYAKNHSDEIILFPHNKDNPKISNTFKTCLFSSERNKKQLINYNSLILNGILNFDITKDNENDIYFIILWNKVIYKFKQQLILFLKLIKKIGCNNDIMYASQHKDINFICETKDKVYGIFLYDFKTKNKIFIEENTKNKNAIQSMSDKIFFPFNNNILENYIFKFQTLFNHLDKIAYYKKIIRKKSVNKNLPIEFITIFNDEHFRLAPETISKINSMIDNYNDNKKEQLDGFIFSSEL